MEEWQKAWLAVAIDGEGTISMFRRTDSRRGVKLRVAIDNVKREYCEFARQITGVGKVYLKTKQNGNRLPRYVWVVQDYPSIRRVLEAIRPYAIIKKEQVELALKFLDIHRFRRHLTEEQDKLEEDIMKKVQLLNLQGRKGRSRAKNNGGANG
jgi:hypothetical protein